MPGPFAGMDPFLEHYWGDVHTSLMVLASMQLQRRLPGDLSARIEEQVACDRDGRNFVSSYEGLTDEAALHPTQQETPMPGPFPGMDPFLEHYWGDVHTSLTAYCRNQLQKQLPADLRARIEEQVTVSVDDERPVDYQPDVSLVERPFLSDDSGGGVAVEVEAGAKLLVPLRWEPLTERSVQIVDRSSGDRVITSIEFLSPWNKRGRRERDRFRQKQERMLDGGVNLVEIDLILAGKWTVSVPQEDMPDEAAYPYRICIIRANASHQAECYRAPLRQRLPRIDIPLRPTDKDAALDLQPLIDQAWTDGDYRDIDYRRKSMPDFDAQDRAWIRDLIERLPAP